jgi:hypothetical protein
VVEGHLLLIEQRVGRLTADHGGRVVEQPFVRSVATLEHLVQYRSTSAGGELIREEG